LIDAYGYSHTILDKNSVEQAVSQINECEITNQICLLEKETFSKILLNKENQLDLSIYPKRSEYLKILNEQFKGRDTIFIGTTGNTAREMYTFMPDTNNFYMVGNMGGALSVGLGMAKAGKKVIVCGGDAEFVMHMGGVITAARYQYIDLTYIIFDNESNKSTGGQKTCNEFFNYNIFIKSLGLIDSKVRSVSMLRNFLRNKENTEGVKLISLKCSYDHLVKRPPLSLIIRNEFN
jgi:phosphonopyruvate decarboxylase